MVNNKIAQRAVAAGLSGLMAFGAAAPAALAYTNYKNFKFVKTNDTDDSAHWKRLAGEDRYGTMKKIIESYNKIQDSTWKSLRKGYSSDEVYNYHSTAVLASGDNWPDALAANGLAGYLTNVGIYDSVGSNGSVPVLITKAGSLTTETKDLLKGMQVQNVIIMGGTAAISQDVEDAINKMGIGTSRVAGKDRQETSVKAMQRINGNWESRDKTYDLIIASGNNYADALSISPYAYRMGTPVILTQKDGTLTDDQVAAIKANDKIAEEERAKYAEFMVTYCRQKANISLFYWNEIISGTTFQPTYPTLMNALLKAKDY
jgi:putative cell wall-binding protein